MAPLAELADLAHAHGARIAVDGAQLVPHRSVDLAASGIDYLAFSGHKIYAPFGAGALVGRGDWLDAAPPYLARGGAVRQVRLDVTEWAASPARHEGGTPNVIGAVALAAACRFVDSLPAGALEAHEGFLTRRLVSGLALDSLRAHGPAWRYADAADGFAPLDDPRALPGWLTGSPAGQPSPCAG
jgi:selenocysteine lyase/cysteine desulfurase